MTANISAVLEAATDTGRVAQVVNQAADQLSQESGVLSREVSAFLNRIKIA